jgi:hypothetical protein
MKIVDPYNASNLHGATNLQAPRRIWQGSEARLPRKVFNRTYDHSAQETEYRLIGIGPFTCRAIAGATGRRA